MKKELSGLIRPAVFIIIGALVGYIYYLMVGYESGTCVISSSPINSMAYFGFLGLLMSGSLCSSCRGGSCNINPKSKKDDLGAENDGLDN